MLAVVMGIGGVLWVNSQHYPTGDEALRPNATQRGDDGITLKGTIVRWVVKRGDEQLIAEPTFAFDAGDRIGFTVLSSTPLHALLLLVHDDGRIEVLFPTEWQSGVIPAKKETTLPLSLSLSPPIELQRIFLILTPDEPVIEDIVVAAKKEVEKLNMEGKGISHMVSLPIDAIVETRLIEPR